MLMKKGENDRCPHSMQKSLPSILQLRLHLNPSSVWPTSSHLCQCFFQCGILCRFQVGTLHIRSSDVPPAMSCFRSTKTPPRSRRFIPKFILTQNTWDFWNRQWFLLKKCYRGCITHYRYRTRIDIKPLDVSNISIYFFSICYPPIFAIFHLRHIDMVSP